MYGKECALGGYVNWVVVVNTIPIMKNMLIHDFFVSCILYAILSRP